MEDQDNVESENEMDVILDTHEVEQEITQEMPVEKEEPRVPLATLQKMRKRAQEAELKAQWLEQQYNKAPKAEEPEDTSQYESATKADLRSSLDEAVRIVEEKLWIKNNPEKYEQINEFLPQFLKQRPNLAGAINSASNRYEEAFTLMDALTPRQQKQIAKAATHKKEAPNAPTGVPKAASLNHAVDVMSMNDQEYAKWRQEQKRRR